MQSHDQPDISTVLGSVRLSSGFSSQGKSTKETDRKRVAEKEKEQLGSNKRHSRKREKEKSQGDRTKRKEELMKDWEEDNMPTETHEHHKKATDSVFWRHKEEYTVYKKQGFIAWQPF